MTHPPEYHASYSVLPQDERFFFGEPLLEAGVFLGGDEQGADFALDEFFGFFDQQVEVGFVDGADDDQVDDAGVLSACVVAGDQGQVHAAEPLDDVLHGVQAQVFAGDAGEFGEERVVGVGAVEAAAAVGFGCDEVGVAHAVELGAHGVGGFAEFVGQSAQVAPGARVGEEFEEQLDPGAGGDQGVEHGWGLAGRWCRGARVPCGGVVFS